MGRKTYLLLWMGSLLVIGISGAMFTEPGYMDAYYYYHVAANLAAGHGLVEDVVWNYLAPVETISHASNLYWMPLTSFIAAPAMAAFGESFRAAQLPMIAIASLSPPATAAVVWDMWRERWLALFSAGLTLFGGFYFYYWSAIDSFGIFALTSLLALWATGRLLMRAERAESPSGHWARSPAVLGLLLGVCAGVAHLARADGLLLLAAGGLALLLRRPSGWRRAAVMGGLGYFTVMGPWYLRTMAVTGSFVVPGSAATMFLQDYNDLFSFNRELTLQSYFAWGLGPIILSKARALGENLLALHGAGLMLLPLSLVGAWVNRRDARLLPFFLYTGLLYLLLTIVFTFPGARGSMRHSGVALLPWGSLLCLMGIRATVAWLAPKRPHWRPAREEKGFSFIALGASAALSIAFLTYNAGVWDSELGRYQAVTAWLQEQGAGPAPVMVTDPPGFNYASGRRAVVTPSDGVDALLAAADRFGVEYLALEAGHDPTLQGLYTGDEPVGRLSYQEWVGTTRMFKVLR